MKKLIGMISILLVTITLACGNQKEDNKNYRSVAAPHGDVLKS